MKQKKFVVTGFFFAALLLAIPLTFQACGGALNFSTPSTVLGSTAGNGDSYAGKLSYYVSFNEALPCDQLGANGTPLPNKEIFILGKDASLVRNNCKNIEPIALNSIELQPAGDGSGDLTFSGSLYKAKPNLDEYNAVPNFCPASRLVLNSARPNNLFLSPLNWLTTDWYRHDGVGVNLLGALEALPRFKLSRIDESSLEYWKRAGQLVSLKSGSDYAYSVLLQPGNVTEAAVTMYQTTGVQFAFVFDLTNGQVSSHHNVGVSNVSARMDRYGDGLVASVFFTAPENSTNIDIGVSTFSSAKGELTTLGDYIYVSAAGLSEVDLYCSP